MVTAEGHPHRPPRPLLYPSFLPRVGPEKSRSLGSGDGSSACPGRCDGEMGAGKRQAWAPYQGFSSSHVLESPCGFLAIVDIIFQCCAWEDLFFPCSPLYVSSASMSVDMESRHMAKSYISLSSKMSKAMQLPTRFGQIPLTSPKHTDVLEGGMKNVCTHPSFKRH